MVKPSFFLKKKVVCPISRIVPALILLLYAWRTGKYCFREPAPVYVIEGGEQEKPEQGEFGLQTEPVRMANEGSSAAFGPAKPNRYVYHGLTYD